jgi:ribonuclease Z
MLAFTGASVIVVDCGGDVVQRLLAAEIELDRIELLVLTHEHPDHTAGFPLFMEKIWLAQRRRPIRVAGPAPALDQARRIFASYDTRGWKGLPEIDWQEVPLTEGASVLETAEWEITASPGRHSVPVIALRVSDRSGGNAVAYSADTEATDTVRRLASNAAILVHEATGRGLRGHASVADAARIARDARAARLVLVHLPPAVSEEELSLGREIFHSVELGRDGGRYDF